MPEAIEFVQLEAGEDATSVRDRLSFYRGQQVLLIWPEEGTALTRRLDLVLVQREAMRRAIRLALVTHDVAITDHARELNISTFETIGAAQRGRWKRGRSKVFTDRDDKPLETPAPEDLMPVASRVRVKPRMPLSGLLRLLLFVAVLALIAGLAVVIVPGATVTLQLAQEELRVETTITASPQAARTDVESAIIPARVRTLELQESGSRQAGGAETLPPITATGIITVINTTTQAFDLPAGTVVRTSGGEPIRFATVTAATLPAGVDQVVEIPIEALPESAGDAGNLAAGLINAIETDWNTLVTVINLSPTSGGETRSVPMVTQDDRDRLMAAVRQQIQARALSEFEAQLAADEILMIETLGFAPESNRADWQTFSAEVGDLTETLTLDLRAIVQVTVVDRRRAEEIVFARMGQRIPRGRLIEADTLSYVMGPVSAVDDQGQVTFTMTGSGRVAGQVDAAQLLPQLAGRTPTEALTYLLSAVDIQPGTTPEISISPDLLGRLPLLPVRITIRVTQGDTDEEVSP